MAAEYYHERSSVTYDRTGRFGGARFQTWDMVRSSSTTAADSDGLGGYKSSHHVLLSSNEEAPAAKLNRSMGFPEGMFQRRSDINRNDYNSYLQNGDGKSTNERTTKHDGYATDHAAQEYLTMTCNKPSFADQPGDGGGWKTSKAHATPVSRATNDIGTAVKHLRESSRPPAATVQSSTPAGANLWKSGMPAMVEQYSYSSSADMMTIDSREAAKKYNGYFM